jgi:tetratricopeptide (TPR) repeat protein
VVILAALATVVLYGLQLDRAPRTLQERNLAAAQAAVNDSPDDATSWLLFAYAQAETGRFSAAEDAVERGKALSDTAAFAIAYAYIAEAQGETDEAIDRYESAKQQAIADAEAQAAELAEVGVSYDTVNTDLADAAIAKARLLAGLDRRQEALAEYDVAIETNPQMADILVERGDLRYSLGDTEGARADYTEALRFMPDMPEALAGLALIGGTAQ